MADLPTRLDLFALGRDYVVQRNPRIDPAQVDTLGSDVNIYVGAGSHLAYAIILQLTYAVRRLLLDGAEGEDLDRYAWDRYQQTRKGASPAVGTVRFYRASATVGQGTIPVGTKVRTSAGVEYILTTAATFAALDLSATASVRAVSAGKTTQVGANQLRYFSTPSSIFDASIQLTNDAPCAGGEEVEDDPTFRERIRNFWSTARRGTLGAIEYGALQVPGVVSAKAYEALLNNAMPARVVNLYIADSSGVASDVLAQSVRANLADYRAGGIPVIVYTSTPQIVDISLKLSFAAGVDTDALGEIVRTAIYQSVNNLIVNETLTRSRLFSVLETYKPYGLIVGDASIVAPAGDLVPNLGSTIRTTLANISLTRV